MNEIVKWIVLGVVGVAGLIAGAFAHDTTYAVIGIVGAIVLGILA